MVLILIIIAVVLYVSFSSEDEPNTFVVETETGRVIKLVYIDWNGSTSNRMDGIISTQIDFPEDKYELVEIDSALSRYDVHIYNRE